MKRSGIVVLMILAIVASVVLMDANMARQDFVQAAANAPAPDTIVLKVGHAMPENHHFQKGLEKFAELVAKKTGNKVKIEIFAGGVLGNNKERAQGIKDGTADMEFIGSTHLGVWVPQLLVADLPFIFRDYQQVDKVLQGEIGKKLEAAAEQQGFKILGWGDNGFRHVFNRFRPVNRVEDLKGLKLRVFPNQVYVNTFSALGAVPLTTDWGELYTALSQKVVDGAEAAPAHFMTNKFYEVGQKYFSLTGHMYTPTVLVMNTKRFNDLPQDIQKALLEAAKEAMSYQRKLAREDESKYIEQMKAKGVKVNSIRDKSRFQEVTKSVYDAWESKIGKDLIDAVKNTK